MDVNAVDFAGQCSARPERWTGLGRPEALVGAMALRGTVFAEAGLLTGEWAIGGSALRW
jgi:hypothetical protein